MYSKTIVGITFSFLSFKNFHSKLHMNCLQSFHSLIYNLIIILLISDFTNEENFSEDVAINQISTNEEHIRSEKEYYEKRGLQSISSLRILDQRLKRVYGSSIEMKLHFYPVLWNISRKFVRNLIRETKQHLKNLEKINFENNSKSDINEDFLNEWQKHQKKVENAIIEINSVLDEFCFKFDVINC